MKPHITKLPLLGIWVAKHPSIYLITRMSRMDEYCYRGKMSEAENFCAKKNAKILNKKGKQND